MCGCILIDFDREFSLVFVLPMMFLFCCKWGVVFCAFVTAGLNDFCYKELRLYTKGMGRTETANWPLQCTFSSYSEISFSSSTPSAAAAPETENMRRCTNYDNSFLCAHAKLASIDSIFQDNITQSDTLNSALPDMRGRSNKVNQGFCCWGNKNPEEKRMGQEDDI